MKLSLQHGLKLKPNPQNPRYQDAFHTKLTTTFENKPNALTKFKYQLIVFVQDENEKIPIIRCDLQSSKHLHNSKYIH